MLSNSTSTKRANSWPKLDTLAALRPNGAFPTTPPRASGWPELMGRYVVSRILQAIPTLLVTSIGIFILLRLIPGDPAQALAGEDARPETVAAIRHDLGLDLPLPIQYLSWLRQMFSGQLGDSILARRPVTDLLGQALPATGELLLASTLVAILLGGLLGITAAVYHRRWPDVLLGWTNALLIGVPGFWLGLLAIILFALVLGWLPPGGRIDPLRDPA